jgi:hypothetical protein
LKKEAHEKYDNVKESLGDYRKAMHHILYQHVTTPGTKEVLRAQIRQAQAPLIVDIEEDRHPWVRRSLELMVNALTLLFTLGIANWHHKQSTGDFLFFARPKSSEALREMEIDVTQLITCNT